MPLGLDMHLGNQWTGCVYVNHLALFSLGGYGFRHAVGGENHGAICWAVFELLNKHGPFGAQAVNDEFVMNDLMADINRRAPFLDRHFDNLDGAINARAESARGSQI